MIEERYFDTMGRARTRKLLEVKCDECGTIKRRENKKKYLNRMHFCDPVCKYANVQFQNKITKTNNERHGGRGNASPSIRQKVKQTCIEVYGVEHPWSDPAIHSNGVETMRGMYGSGGVLGSAVLRPKFEATMMARFGVPHPMKCPEIVKKIGDTNLERYGSTCSMQGTNRQNIEARWLEKYGTIVPLTHPDIKAKIDYSESWRKRQATMIKNGTWWISKPEKSLVEWLELVFGVNDVKTQLWVNRKSVDAYVISLQLFIELDGAFFHGLLKGSRKFPSVAKKVERDQTLDRWFNGQYRYKLFRLTDLQWLAVTEGHTYDVLLEQINAVTIPVSHFDHMPGYVGDQS